ncbi:MAG: virulence RhuM family protein [Desulfosporosinus sp.]
MSFKNHTEILIYQTEDGQTKIDVQIEDETVWLNQAQMVELFQTTKQNISLHINNCFKEGELKENAVVKEYLTTATDGKSYKIKYYNLDVIISIGYRVKSHRGTQFRIWATQRLKEYIIKGFTMNDDLFKKAGGGNYFDELLKRIRDIRSSEKVFWKKVLEIYATSIDYDPSQAMTKKFFQTIQNKMHWASHGHTAAEIIALRAKAEDDFMGLTNFKGKRVNKSDVVVAKNYLNEEEIEILNLIVSSFIDFAELQAKLRKPMYMQDWVNKLDDFLKISERDILTHAGNIKHDDAVRKAEAEYEKYKERTKNDLSPVERDFLRTIEQVGKKLNAKTQKKTGGDGV